MNDEPRVLVFPDWPGNAFLNVLAMMPRAASYRFEGADTLGALVARAARLRHGDALHIHWTSPIAQDAPTARVARRGVTTFTALLRLLRLRGVGIIWTIHNQLPHELPYRDAEIALFHALARHSDVIHVMSPATQALMSDWCPLNPKRVTHIPHPSYVGVYDSGVDRAAARRTLGVPEGAHAVLFLGQLRPYKGLDVLVDAVERAHRVDPRVMLLIAGAVVATERDEIEQLLTRVPHVKHLDFVADSDVATWFTAADVTVFPYRAVLNSGSAHLAASFAVPTILPDEKALRSVFGTQPWVAFVEDEARAADIAAHLIARTPARDVTSARSFALDLAPRSVSNRYLDMLDALTGNSAQHRRDGAQHGRRVAGSTDVA